MKRSILGLLVLSGLLMADFVRDDALEVVNDTTTCLMWQDDVASKTVKKTWTDAVDHCEDMNFAGFDDWRLPNFNELYSIGDRSRYAPAIQIAFSNVVSDDYWSATSTTALTATTLRPMTVMFVVLETDSNFVNRG